METRFTILLWEVGIAVAVQVGVLVAMLIMVKRSSDKVNALAADTRCRSYAIAGELVVLKRGTPVHDPLFTLSEARRLGRTAELEPSLYGRVRFHARINQNLLSAHGQRSNPGEPGQSRRTR